MLLKTITILAVVAIASCSPTVLHSSGLEIQDASLFKKVATPLGGGLHPIPNCNYTICGGEGIITDIRIICGDEVCPAVVTPGQVCTMEVDFVPSSFK